MGHKETNIFLQLVIIVSAVTASAIRGNTASKYKKMVLKRFHGPEDLNNFGNKTSAIYDYDEIVQNSTKHISLFEDTNRELNRTYLVRKTNNSNIFNSKSQSYFKDKSSYRSKKTIHAPSPTDKTSSTNFYTKRVRRSEMGGNKYEENEVRFLFKPNDSLTTYNILVKSHSQLPCFSKSKIFQNDSLLHTSNKSYTFYPEKSAALNNFQLNYRLCDTMKNNVNINLTENKFSEKFQGFFVQYLRKYSKQSNEHSVVKSSKKVETNSKDLNLQNGMDFQTSDLNQKTYLEQEKVINDNFASPNILNKNGSETYKYVLLKHIDSEIEPYQYATLLSNIQPINEHDWEKRKYYVYKSKTNIQDFKEINKENYSLRGQNDYYHKSVDMNNPGLGFHKLLIDTTSKPHDETTIFSYQNNSDYFNNQLSERGLVLNKTNPVLFVTTQNKTEVKIYHLRNSFIDFLNDTIPNNFNKMPQFSLSKFHEPFLNVQLPIGRYSCKSQLELNSKDFGDASLKQKSYLISKPHSQLLEAGFFSKHRDYFNNSSLPKHITPQPASNTNLNSIISMLQRSFTKPSKNLSKSETTTPKFEFTPSLSLSYLPDQEFFLNTLPLYTVNTFQSPFITLGTFPESKKYLTFYKSVLSNSSNMNNSNKAQGYFLSKLHKSLEKPQLINGLPYILNSGLSIYGSGMKDKSIDHQINVGHLSSVIKNSGYTINKSSERHQGIVTHYSGGYSSNTNEQYKLYSVVTNANTHSKQHNQYSTEQENYDGSTFLPVNIISPNRDLILEPLQYATTVSRIQPISSLQRSNKFKNDLKVNNIEKIASNINDPGNLAFKRNTILKTIYLKPNENTTSRLKEKLSLYVATPVNKIDISAIYSTITPIQLSNSNLFDRKISTEQTLKKITPTNLTSMNLSAIKENISNNRQQSNNYGQFDNYIPALTDKVSNFVTSPFKDSLENIKHYLLLPPKLKLAYSNFERSAIPWKNKFTNTRVHNKHDATINTSEKISNDVSKLHRSLDDQLDKNYLPSDYYLESHASPSLLITMNKNKMSNISFYQSHNPNAINYYSRKASNFSQSKYNSSFTPHYFSSKLHRMLDNVSNKFELSSNFSLKNKSLQYLPVILKKSRLLNSSFYKDNQSVMTTIYVNTLQGHSTTEFHGLIENQQNNAGSINTSFFLPVYYLPKTNNKNTSSNTHFYSQHSKSLQKEHRFTINKSMQRLGGFITQN